MKTHVFTIAVASSLLLAACGGSNNNHVENQHGKDNPNKNNPRDTHIISYQKSNNRGVAGGFVQIAGSKKQRADIAQTLDTQDTLIIDGQTYNLKKPAGEWQHSGFIDQKFSRAGWLSKSNKAKDGFDLAFYQGQSTANMPTTGSIKYTGDAYVYRKNKENEKVASTFTADFAKKTLAGVIQSKTPIMLEATIKGNTFMGNKNGINTQGGFYGANADEIAGTFTNDKQDMVGYFGAKK